MEQPAVNILISRNGVKIYSTFATTMIRSELKIIIPNLLCQVGRSYQRILFRLMITQDAEQAGSDLANLSDVSAFNHCRRGQIIDTFPREIG